MLKGKSLKDVYLVLTYSGLTLSELERLEKAYLGLTGINTTGIDYPQDNNLQLELYDNSIDFGEFIDEIAQGNYTGIIASGTIKKLSKITHGDIYAIKESLKKENVEAIFIGEEIYPEVLRNIYDPPRILFCKGNINLLDSQCLAIVGSRRPDSYAIEAVKRVVNDISDYEICIVSGMAMGIDEQAHRLALSNDMSTIAVLGSSIDKPYPVKNRRLYKEIIESGGLVISETGVGCEYFKSSFALRNRIIAGLSRGVLVVSAKLKSGSLITAAYANDHGRDVFAVMGSIFSKLYEGTNELIKSGAIPVTEGLDIISCYSKIFQKKQNIKKDTCKNTYICDNLNIDCKNLIELLDRSGTLSYDELFIKANMSPAIFNASLNRLLLMDAIVKEGSDAYTLNL